MLYLSSPILPVSILPTPILPHSLLYSILDSTLTLHPPSPPQHEPAYYSITPYTRSYSRNHYSITPYTHSYTHSQSQSIACTPYIFLIITVLQQQYFRITDEGGAQVAPSLWEKENCILEQDATLWNCLPLGPAGGRKGVFDIHCGRAGCSG